MLDVDALTTSPEDSVDKALTSEGGCGEARPQSTIEGRYLPATARDARRASSSALVPWKRSRSQVRESH